MMGRLAFYLAAVIALSGSWSVGLAQGITLAKGDSIRVQEILTTHSILQLQLPPEVDPKGDGKINRDDRSRLVSSRRVALVAVDPQGKLLSIRVSYEATPPALLTPANGEQVVDVSTPLAGRSYEIDCSAGKVSRTDAVPVTPEESAGLKDECTALTRVSTARATLGSPRAQSPLVLRDAALAAVLPRGLDCLGFKELRLTAVGDPAGGVSYKAEADAEQRGVASQITHQTYTGTARIDNDGSVRWVLSYKGTLRIPLAGGGAPATGASAGDVELFQRVAKFPITPQP